MLRGDPSGHAAGGAYVSAQVNAPPGITITGATSNGSVFNLNNGTGWVGGSFFAGGGSAWSAVTSILSDPPFASSYWGAVVECAPGYACGGAGQITLRSITLSATESQGPSLSAQGSGNLWYQTRQGEWIWNAPGDPWPLTIAASDPSGVCSMSAAVGQHELPRTIVSAEHVAVAAVPRPDVDTERRRQRRHARLRARCRHASVDDQRDQCVKAHDQLLGDAERR